MSGCLAWRYLRCFALLYGTSPPVVLPQARSAVTSAVGVDAGVLLGQFMASAAMGEQVPLPMLSRRQHLQMVEVHAAHVPTGVMEVPPLRNRPMRLLVDVAVSVLSRCRPAVAASVTSFRPLLALTLVRHGEEDRRRGGRDPRSP